MKALLQLLTWKSLAPGRPVRMGRGSNLRFAIGLSAILLCVCIGKNSVLAVEPLAIDPPAQPNAQNPELTYSPQWPEPPNTGAMLARLGIGTVVVLILCVGSLWLGKPWLLKMQGVSSGSPLLHVQGSVPLGSRAMLYLVKVGDTQLVAGTDATGLKSLVVIPATFRDVLDAQLPATEPIVAPTEYFAAHMSATEGSKE